MPTRDDLSGLPELLAVVDRRSFTAAAAALRVTPSAVSQSVRALEERVGVRLLERTTRSVRLTEAGARFVAQLRPALECVRGALEGLDEARGRPIGTLRLNVPRLAVASVLQPLLATFLAAHPGLRLEISVDDGLTSIVDSGCDAGIRLGELLEKDMVAVRVSGDLRMAVVASPGYFAARGKPKHPRDLHAHDCINYRQIASGNVYRWEFTERGRDFSIAVEGRLTTNDADLMLGAALEGCGVAYVMESAAREALASESLVRVLTAYCPRFPGLYLYYPSQRQLPAKLRAFIDFVRARES